MMRIQVHAQGKELTPPTKLSIIGQKIPIHTFVAWYYIFYIDAIFKN